MPPLPIPSNDTARLIDEYHESIPNRPRSYLGPSSAGVKCDRALWYQFRWVDSEEISGRMLRLFRRGTMEEVTALKDIEAIGCNVIHTGSDQININFGPHIFGHPDGVIESGLPEAPKSRHIWECKTHNKKSFDALEKEGVEKSKPAHFIQMQLYMHGTHIERALYYAVCKDDDRIYTERIKYQKEIAVASLERLSRIIYSDYAPARISDNPAWFECKWCSYFQVCHNGKLPKRNCRTCLHSTPGLNNYYWDCALDGGSLDTAFQQEACRGHVPHPDLVPWKMRGEECTKTSAYCAGIGLVGKDGIDSREILI